MKQYTLTKGIKRDWFTVEQATTVIDTIINNPRRIEFEDKLLTRTLDASIYALDFICKKLEPITLALWLNKVDALDEHYSSVIGKLAYKVEGIQIPNVVMNVEYVKSYAATLVSHIILQTLMDLGMIYHRTRNIKHSINGRETWRMTTTVTFGVSNEEDYIKGIHLTPGVVTQKRFKVRAGGKALKLNKTEKDILRMASSFKLRLVQDFSREEFIASLKTGQDYLNVQLKKNKTTDIIIQNALVEEAANKYEWLQSFVDGVYLEQEFDYRTRLYYTFTEYGIAPHGGGHQKYIWEAANPVVITESFRDRMKSNAVVIVNGRMPREEALVKYNNNPDYYQEKLREVQYTTREGITEDIVVVDYGTSLYNRRLADAILADETRFLLGEDATNGGLQGAGIGFKSINMMVASNVGGSDEVHDSHGDLAKAAGVTRDEAKVVNQGALHGQSLMALAKVLECSVKDAKLRMIAAYGMEFLNIPEIAQWGSDIANNSNTSLLWKTRDGLRAQSIYYTEGVELESYCISTTNVNPWSTIKLHKEMPLIRDHKGEVIFRPLKREDGSNDSHLARSLKVRGLYANIQHSNDATRLRGVMAALYNAGVESALFVHDNFFVNEHMDLVHTAYQEELLEEFEFSPFERAIVDIQDNYTGTLTTSAPVLIIGQGTKDMIEKSKYFLSA